MMLNQAVTHLAHVVRDHQNQRPTHAAIRILIDALLLQPGPGQVVELLRAELGIDEEENYPPVKTYKDRLDVLERQMKILLRGSVAFPPIEPPPVSNPQPSDAIGKATIQYEVKCFKYEKVKLTLIAGNELMLSDVQTSELVKKLEAAAAEIPF